MDLYNSDIRIKNKLPDHSGKQKNIRVIVNRVKTLYKKKKTPKLSNKLNYVLFVNNLLGQNIPDAHEGTEISL